jgi:ATP-binding cassette subfamily F protein 3
VDGGRVAPVDGDQDDYPARLLRRQSRREQAAVEVAPGSAGGKAGGMVGGTPGGTTGGIPGGISARSGDPQTFAAVPDNSATGRKDQRRQEAEERKRLQPLRQRLRKLEEQLDRLTARRAALEAELAVPAIYETEGKPRLLKLLADKQQLDAEQEEAETAWLEASEAMESATGG